jgi:drug/metabolite transporter (DMT)-like permease
MIPILGGLGAAVMWATTTLCSSRASRLIGPGSVLAWVMLIGLLVVGPAAAMKGAPGTLDASTAVLLLVAGLGNVVGLLLEYAALRVGKVAIVAPILSTEGAAAAVIAVAAGERIRPGEGAVLVVIAAGVVLAGAARREPTTSAQRHEARATLFAIAAAAAFGTSLYATAQVGTELPIAWAVLPARLVGVVAVALPLALTSRLRLTRRAVPLVVASGLAEVLGFASFVVGARHSLAVSAVIASQFAGITAILAFLLFRERLVPVQMAGIAVIAGGVAVLSALHP